MIVDKKQCRINFFFFGFSQILGKISKNDHLNAPIIIGTSNLIPEITHYVNKMCYFWFYFMSSM